MKKLKHSYIPHVVECSVGTDRLFLTILFDAYDEDMVKEKIALFSNCIRILRRIKAAFLPLTKEQAEPMKKIFRDLKASKVFSSI